MSANAEAQTFLRRIEILQRLPARGSGLITAGQLTTQLEAAGFPVQKRTVERDLEFLRESAQGFGALHCDDRSKPFGWSIERSTTRRAHMGLSVDEVLQWPLLANVRLGPGLGFLLVLRQSAWICVEGLSHLASSERV